MRAAAPAAASVARLLVLLRFVTRRGRDGPWYSMNSTAVGCRMPRLVEGIPPPSVRVPSASHQQAVEHHVGARHAEAGAVAAPPCRPEPAPVGSDSQYELRIDEGAQSWVPRLR